MAEWAESWKKNEENSIMGMDRKKKEEWQQKNPLTTEQ